MKRRKLKVEIEVWEIEIEETQKYENGNGVGWWKFRYSVRINGGKKRFGQKDGSWSGQSRAHFSRALRRGYAEKEVLMNLY